MQNNMNEQVNEGFDIPETQQLRVARLAELVSVCQAATDADILDRLADELDTFNDFFMDGNDDEEDDCCDSCLSDVEALLSSACWVAIASNENISRKLYVNILQSVAFSDNDQPELREAIEMNEVGDSF